MNEEMEIMAFEILEKQMNFAELSAEDKAIVIRAFGSEEAYIKMVSISDIAFEEEEILAPSLKTQSALSNQFKKAHSETFKEDHKRFSIQSFFANRIVRFAFPMILVIVAFIWFNKQGGITNENVSINEQKTQDEQPSLESNSIEKDNSEIEINQENEEFRKDLNTLDELKNEDLKPVEDIKVNVFEDEIEEEISLSLETDINEVPDQNIPAEEHPGFGFDMVPTDNASSTQVILSDSVFNENHSYKWADAEVQEKKEETAYEEFDLSDDSYGNSSIQMNQARIEKMKASEEILAQESKSRTKAISKALKYKAISTDATHDSDLFEFLFTTY